MRRTLLSYVRLVAAALLLALGAPHAVLAASPQAPPVARPVAVSNARKPAVVAPSTPPTTTPRAAPVPSTLRVSATAPAARVTQAPVRDWARAPAIVEHESRGDVYAVSDIHGHYEDSVRLLVANKLVAGDPAAPAQLRWTGGNATLVIVGDIINKGDGSLKVIDMLRALQGKAEKEGGKVIVTMGNHEADFLERPNSERSLFDGKNEHGRFGLGGELRANGIDPSAVAQGADPQGRGAWLRALPIAAKVGRYFFIHSGNTNGMTKEELEKSVQATVEHGGFGHENLIGGESSPLGTDNWQATVAHAKTNAARLGVARVVMGHAPDALSSPGTIARTTDRALVKIDTGLGNDTGPPRLLHLRPRGAMLQRGDDGHGHFLHEYPGE